MEIKDQNPTDRWDPEPRWPAFIAILAVGGLYAALPRYLVVGPHWLFPAIVLVLLLPTVISHGMGHHAINRFFGFTVLHQFESLHHRAVAVVVGTELQRSEQLGHHAAVVPLVRVADHGAQP